MQPVRLVFQLGVAFLVLGLAVLANNHEGERITVEVPYYVTNDAVEVAPDLLSFSLEADRWPEWISTSPDYQSKNEFTANVLKNLEALSGATPSLRIGGNTEDRAIMSGDVQVVSTTYPAPTTSMPYPEAVNFTINDGYFSLARFSPPGTKMTFGLNFGKLNASLAIQQTNSILSAFQSQAVRNAGVSLELIELGNEPNLYPNNGLRGRDYSITGYVTEWSDFTSQVINATSLIKPRGEEPSIIALSFSGSDHGAGRFSPQKAFTDGLLGTHAGDFISSISQHTYSGGCCSARISDLMSKALIRSNLTQFIPDIQDVKSKGLDYVMGELNSYYNHGVPNVSDSAGAAIWILDYTLFAATLGMSRLFFHQGIGFKYNLWQPVTLDRSIQDGTPVSPSIPPYVQAPYLGVIALADFLGTQGPRRLVEIDVPHPSISAYALYTDGKTARVLFINHETFIGQGDGGAERNSVSIDLQFLAEEGVPTSVNLKRMKIPSADAKKGLSWGGINYDTSDGRPSGEQEVTRHSLEEAIVLHATEAVMVTFRRARTRNCSPRAGRR